MAATAPARTMRAAVLHTPGPNATFSIESFPIQVPEKGQVLIRVKAFGINRSELFTRLGQSPGIVYPRILGIEAAGIVEEAPGNEFQKGDVVATCMGGMGMFYPCSATMRIMLTFIEDANSTVAMLSTLVYQQRRC